MILLKKLYDKLVTNVNAIDTSGFVLKTQYNTDKSNLEKMIDVTDKKIHGTSGLVKKMVKSLRLNVKYLL